MSPGRHAFAAFLALTLFSFPANAQAEAVADLTARTLQAEGGVVATGNIATFHQFHVEGPLPSPLFQLLASEVRVETQAADSVLLPGSGLNPFPSGSQATFTDVHIDGTRLYPGFKMELVNEVASTFQLSNSCLTEVPSAEKTSNIDPKVNQSRPAIERDVSEAAKITACSASQVLVEGDFVLSLWEWDANLDAVEGSQYLESGFKGTTPSGPAAAGRAQQQYLHVRNGELRLPLAEGIPQRLFAQGHSLSTNGTVLLEGATVAIQGTSFAGTKVSVVGESTLLVQPHDTGIQAGALGVFSITADGQTIYESSATVAVDSSSEFPWLAPTVLILALLAVAWFLPVILGRRFAQRYNESALKHPRARAFFWSGLSLAASDRDHGRLAKFLAWRAIRNTPIGKEALLARARANSVLGRLEAEITDHELLHRVLVSDRERAANAVQAAKTLLQLDEKAEALAWLKVAWKECPNVVNQHMANPALAKLRNDPWVRMQEDAWWYYT